MRKLFSACNHMHAQGVVHRDIKPENIMMTKQGELKLIDFGLSQRQNKKQNDVNSIAGTPYYMAPEVLEGRFDSKSDIWSLGVIFYVFMCGYLPFQGDTRNEVFYKIVNGKYHFNHNEFNYCSKESKDLIEKLLEVDPLKRFTAAQALQHPFFQRNLKKDVTAAKTEGGLNLATINRLRSFRGQSKLKRAAMTMMVKMADQK